MLGWSLATSAVLAVFALLAAMPPMSSVDDRMRRDAVFVLASGHGTFIKYSIVLSAVAVVPYRLGRAIGLGQWTIDQFVLLVWVAWSLLIGARLHALRGTKFAVGVVTLTTFSMFSLYVTGFNAEAFALMLVSYGALLTLDGGRTRTRAIGAAVMAVGAACIPVQVFALGVVGVVMLVRRRNPWFVGAAVAAAAMVVADATWSNGHLSFSKYVEDEIGRFSELLPWGNVARFGYPLVFGLVGILFSFGRGLVWFQPGLFLRSVRTSDDTDVVRTWRRTLTLLVIVMVPLYSKWWAWYAGFAFGPRFFLLGVVPAAVVVTERLQSAHRLGAWMLGALLALWSAWVSIAGSVFYMLPAANRQCRIEHFRYEPLCWFFPEYSALLGPLWEDWHVTGIEVVFMVVAPAVMVGLVWWLTPRPQWRQLGTSTVTLARSARP